jgi:hypothetical protein
MVVKAQQKASQAAEDRDQSILAYWCAPKLAAYEQQWVAMLHEPAALPMALVPKLRNLLGVVIRRLKAGWAERHGCEAQFRCQRSQIRSIIGYRPE